MFKLSVIIRFAFISTLLLLIGCKEDDNSQNTDDFDRQAILVNMADNLIIPVFEELDLKSATLKEASENTITILSVENIEDLKNAWEETLMAWQWAAPYDFGPSADLGLVSAFNLFPVNTDLINQNIASGDYNLESAANVSATGLQAIDYLLFGTADSSTELVTYFEANPNALVYILDIATLLSTKATANLGVWNGSYRATFINANGTDLGSSLSLIINGAIRYFEIHLRDGKIGFPSGARSSSNTAMPEQSEALYNGALSRNMLYEGLTAWQYFFNGTNITGVFNGQGLDDYLAFLGPTFDGNPLADEINTRFDEALVNISQLSPAISDAVDDQQSECLDIFEELQRIIVLLKVDMTAAMGVQITFVDNDGD